MYGSLRLLNWTTSRQRCYSRVRSSARLASCRWNNCSAHNSSSGKSWLRRLLWQNWVWMELLWNSRDMMEDLVVHMLRWPLICCWMKISLRPSYCGTLVHCNHGLYCGRRSLRHEWDRRLYILSKESGLDLHLRRRASCRILRVQCSWYAVICIKLAWEWELCLTFVALKTVQVDVD